MLKSRFCRDNNELSTRLPVRIKLICFTLNQIVIRPGLTCPRTHQAKWSAITIDPSVGWDEFGLVRMFAFRFKPG